MKISCVESLGLGRTQLENLKQHYLQLGHQFDYYLDRQEDETSLIQRMHDADIVVVSNIPISANILSQCPKLRYLSIAFTGLDHIDLEFCRQHNITVQNAAGYSTTAVSELAVGMMLDLLRHITTFDGLIRQGASRGNFLGRELRGKTVGIIGTGAIGTATIRLLLAFGCHVIAWNRSIHPEVESLGVAYTSLDELLTQSDIVSLHLPLTPETQHLIATPQLALMKPTALLINTARGAVCDINAVATALTQGQIAGAAFDVFEQEPPLPSDHPLLSAPQCLITPHIAFATQESFQARAEIVFGHVDQFLNA